MARTHVELRDDQLERIRTLAAKRGEHGFSRVLQELVDAGLAAKGAPKEDADDELEALMGSLSPKESREFRRRVAKGRKQPW